MATILETIQNKKALLMLFINENKMKPPLTK